VPEPPPPAPAPDFVEGIDVASYQPADLTPIFAEREVGHVVVRLYLPQEKPSQQHSVDQMQSARGNGKSVGGYMWPYAGMDQAKAVRDALDLANRAGFKIPILWLDIEPTPDGEIPTIEEIWQCLNASMMDYNQRAGIYTAKWVFDQYYTGFEGFAEDDIPLWVAQHDGIPDPNVFEPFAGWTRCEAKQYGVEKWSGGEVDVDVFRVGVTG
jgi:hypothetical protein